MQRKLLSAAICMLCFYSAMAQKTEPVATAKPFTYKEFIVNDSLNKYQLGINSQFAIEGLFNDSIRTPIEVIIRRQVNPYGAIRLRIMGISQNYRREEHENFNEIHTSTLGVALGYEWQHLISRRWKWYYGADVQGKLYWNNSVKGDEILVTNQFVEQRVVTKRRTDQIALLPFAGIRYHITPHLFVSTEIRIEALYQKFNFESANNLTGQDGAVGTSRSAFTIKKANFSFQPYSGIYLNLIL